MTTTAPREGRTAWWWARTAAYVVGCAFMSLSSGVFSALGAADGHGWQLFLQLVMILAAVAVPSMLFWRQRIPFTVTLTASGAALVLPIGTSTALVALAGLIARRRGPQVWWAAGAVAAATIASSARDAGGATKETSFYKQLFGPTAAPADVPVDLSAWVVVVCVLVLLGLSVGAGLLARSRRETAAATERVRDATRASGRLNDQLSRQVERERIAREVHDVLGHRLSLLNLHAGALEARAVGDPELNRSARLVRESARASVDDLRSLINVLREPLGEAPATPDLTLVDLPKVIDEAVRTGVPITSTVYLDGAETAGPTLSRAVYRIVQELLTNARKHAPGEQLWLQVHGGPTAGVTIDARNRYPGSAGGGPGRGLQGIAERAELLGGTLTYGLDDGGRLFRVTVSLPWSTD
ncbi:sensor histidine kinase [Georgenia sp. AZ-5]|uniref:sensor histidine kinase n=1 Tax=Georgenia sp. AZ-5 TaxID=3367526 RepID=UPI00375470A9